MSTTSTTTSTTTTTTSPFDPNFFIETPRLYITHFQPALDAHCDFLVALYNTPEFVASSGRTSITSRDAARTHIEQRFAQWLARNGYGQYLVALKPSSSSSDAAIDLPADAPFQERLAQCKLIGNVSLMRGDSATAYAAPDLGFAILPEEMRKGYATEAARALVEYAKRELGVDVVLGLTDPANEGALAVFRSLGFEDRGVRTLVEFGGVRGAVWVSPGAAEDLSAYNL
ncbi:acyl-CoA N-acyltransferase [Earliella scabrosa]|nr:acyl-CoA N-acyltransferase [Earliella scabrosa]